jgi:splicing factor 3B subunit 1
MKEGSLKSVNGSSGDAQPKKRKRWDQAAEPESSVSKKSSWDVAEANTPSNSHWDETPGRAKGAETPGAQPTPGPSTRMWDITPGHATPGAATPGHDTQATPSARRNRWDETPKTERGMQ